MKPTHHPVRILIAIAAACLSLGAYAQIAPTAAAHDAKTPDIATSPATLRMTPVVLPEDLTSKDGATTVIFYSADLGLEKSLVDLNRIANSSYAVANDAMAKDFLAEHAGAIAKVRDGIIGKEKTEEAKQFVSSKLQVTVISRSTTKLAQNDAGATKTP